MRAVFGILGLLLVLVIVGFVARKQLAATRQAVPALAVPAVEGAPSLAVNPDASVKAQSQQIQQQYRQALDAAMQQARPGPDASDKP